MTKETLCTKCINRTFCKYTEDLGMFTEAIEKVMNNTIDSKSINHVLSIDLKCKYRQLTNARTPKGGYEV